MESQLTSLLPELRREVPKAPQWGVKENSEGKNEFWYGYKAHLAVSASSQYILQSLVSSENLNDGKAAIPLLKGIEECLSFPAVRYQTMDTGYDYEPIYQQMYRMNQQSIIVYNKRNELEFLGFDKHFVPTCVRGHSYRYDSYDAKYKTLKYTHPTECSDCLLAQEGLCQKGFKMKMTKGLRRYTALARGSVAWKKQFKKRTATGRVNAYLKEFFQLDNVRYRPGERAKVRGDMVTLIYNASKLAADRLGALLNDQQAA